MGVIEVSTGAGGSIVKTTGSLVPPTVVTVMLCGPSGAAAVITKVARIWVALIAGVASREMPDVPGTDVRATPSALMVEPVRKVPVRVTATFVPRTPDTGAMLVSVGAGGTTVNGIALLPMPASLTEMLVSPRGAVNATVKVALSE